MIGLLDIEAACRLAAERGQLLATEAKRAIAESEKAGRVERRGRPGATDPPVEEGQSRSL
jgi:hypothetical protein